MIPDNIDGPLYISGYMQGVEIEGVLDYQKVKAIYINYYGDEVLMISIDCIGLSSTTISKIRNGINQDINVNVSSTHTHSGIDTLGLWGPVAINGKNDEFMELLIKTAIKAGNEAITNSKEGVLTYGKIQTENILEDSRFPYVFDETMYQLKFIPNDNSENTRLIFYGAHAESLRGKNKLLSADFPAVMAKAIKDETNDNCIYFNAAIGGLVMTRVFDENDLVNNMKITGNLLAQYALSINETPLQKGVLKQETTKFYVQLDNTLYLYYKFLGIVENNVYKNIFNGKYYIESEVSILQISNITFILIPGEIFPELVYGGSFENPLSYNENDITISELAKSNNVDELIIIGLCNDELGYIVPPSDYLVNPEYPYIKDFVDPYDENHYEETNSVGINMQYELIKALKKIFNKLK